MCQFGISKENVGESVWESFIELGRGKLDQEGGQPIDEDLHHLMRFFGFGLMGIAGAGVGGEKMPGTSDGDPAAIDGVEAGLGGGSVVGGELAVGRFSHQMRV